MRTDLLPAYEQAGWLYLPFILGFGLIMLTFLYILSAGNFISKFRDICSRSQPPSIDASRRDAYNSYLRDCCDCGRCGRYQTPTKKCTICPYLYPGHNTSEHKCLICGSEGAESHMIWSCPERCTICVESHKTSEHECWICKLVGEKSHKWTDCKKKCTICTRGEIWHTTSEHKCDICGWIGESSHSYEDCPYKDCPDRFIVSPPQEQLMPTH